MRQIQVDQGQCLMDVAVQHCGDATALFEIAELNGISITEVVGPGTVLNVPDAYDQQVASYLVFKRSVPATGLWNENLSIVPRLGIGTMKIGSTFKVY